MNKIFLIIMLLFSIIFSMPAEDMTVDLTRITGRIWLHVSSQTINGYKVPSNGLVVDTGEGVIFIDTPWTDALTEELIKMSKEKFKKDIILAVITHAHQDRIGGIKALHKNNIITVSTEHTANLAALLGYPRPVKRLDKDITELAFKNIKFETYYPGAGHTADNIVVWFPEDKILFGGCLIKSEDTVKLGNTAEADMEQWPVTLHRLKKRYTDIRIYIPGHGGWSRNDLIKHTLDLFGKK